MPASSSQSASSQVVVTLAALVIIIAGMKAASPLLVPFLLSIFLAIISAHPMIWMKRKGIPHIVAIMLIIVFIAVTMFLLTAMVSTSVDNFSSSLPRYQARLAGMLSGIVDWLRGHGISIVPGKALLAEHVNPGSAMSLAARLLNAMGSVLTNSFLIILTVIFILLEASTFPAKLRLILKNPVESTQRIQTLANSINSYLLIKTVTSAITGVLVAIWLWALGVDYPVLWGLLAFMLNYIPNIGSIIAAVPAVLLALVQLGLMSALWTAVGYLVVNSLIGSILEPKVMGRGLGLSTLVVFLSLVFWGWVLGPVGMFLSVPLTMAARIALDYHEDTRWIAILLGPEVNPDGSPIVTSTEAAGPGTGTG